MLATLFAWRTPLHAPRPVVHHCPTSRCTILAGLREDILEYKRAAFDAVDLDGNNQIDRVELQSALQDIGISLAAERAGTLFATYDADENGMIDFEEFEHLLLTASLDPVLFTESDFRAAFDAVDADSNGVISVDELQVSLGRLTESTGASLPQETIVELFACYDEDKNGVLDFEEYKLLLLMSGLPVLLSELLLNRFVRNQFAALDFA